MSVNVIMTPATKNNRVASLKVWLTAFVVYTLLSFIVYFPGILHFFDAPLAWFEGGGIYYRIWWFNEVFAGRGNSIWFMPNMLPPHGMPVMLQSNGVGRELIFSIFGGGLAPQLVGNFYGCSIALTVALTTFGVLKKLLRGAVLPALVGGWMCGWSGSLVTHIATPWISSSEGVVGFLGCLLLMRRGRHMAALSILAGVSAAVAAWFQLQLLNHLAVIGGVFVVDALIRRKWNALLWVALSVCIGAALSAPALYQTYKDFGGDLSHMGGESVLTDMYLYRNSIPNFFLPFQTGKLTGWVTQIILDGGYDLRPIYAAYFGIVTIALAIIGVRSRRSGTGFLAVLFVTFALLSCGPVISWDWKPVAGGPLFGATWVPGPFYLLKDLPIFSSLRTPGRLMLGGQIALAFLAAHGLLTVLRWRSIRVSRTRRVGVAALVLLLYLLDFSKWPTKFSEPQYSTYWEEIAREPGDFAVLDVPYRRGMDNYMHYGAYHHKTVLWGYGGRVPSAWYEPMETDLRFALVSTDYENTWPRDFGRFAKNLLKYRVRYIILHEMHLNLDPISADLRAKFVAMMNNPETWEGQNYIDPPKEVHNDPIIRVWRITRAAGAPAVKEVAPPLQ